MPLAARVLDTFRREKLTLACAESLTGGLFGARLTTLPGASDVLAGGFIVYTDSAKTALLGVDRALLEKEGGVSAAVAKELARGAREALASDIAVSLVGFAGPDVPPGGERGKVFIALAHWGGVESHALHLPGDRDAVREGAVDAALRYLLDAAERAARARG